MSDARNHDDVIDRWLKRASSVEAGPGPNAGCLDAEVMAAWADGGLSAEALRAVRAHVADCARCQVLAAVMTRLEPAEVPAAVPARRWLVWLGPLAAAAGALAIWVLIPRQPAVFQEGAAPQTQIAQAPAQTPAAPPAIAVPRPAEERTRPTDPAAPKLKAERQNAPDLKRQVNEKDARAANVARADEQRDRAAAADPKKTDARLAAPPAAAAPAAAVPPTVGMAQAAADAGARREQVMAESRLSKEIVSADSAVRWRVQGSQVAKTVDAGKNWTPVTTGVTADLTAGASTSPTTCWLVGRGGVVLLTTDGSTWRRLEFPEAADLSAVRATDARSAVVTTVSGREYVTSDGGSTWVRRFLQEN